MARSVNKVTLIGNLGNDPEMKALPSGSQVANLSICNRPILGAIVTVVRCRNALEWHRIVCFDRLAEICGQYLRKGSRIYIEGSLRTRSWEQDGHKRYSTEIVGREMMMLDGRGDSDMRHFHSDSVSLPKCPSLSAAGCHTTCEPADA